ncbi:MAG: dual specificity protein phosphatase family protein [Bacteroidales bacterium]|nr:dual specificity protein phosphatase family protein [Bacteroidales bacterium]
MKHEVDIFEKVKKIQLDDVVDLAKIDALIEELREIISNNTSQREKLAPLIGQLFKFKKTFAPDIKKPRIKLVQRPLITDKNSYWVKIYKGFLKIGHLPGKKNGTFNTLKNEGTNTALSLLSEREGASKIGQEFQSLSINWLWLPLENGNPPSKELLPLILKTFNIIKSELTAGNKIYIHCSAGLHRTGMITYALLVFLGYDLQEAYDLLIKLRPLTAYEVRKKRLEWGQQFQNM